jgi:hypothetical protein
MHAGTSGRAAPAILEHGEEGMGRIREAPPARLFAAVMHRPGYDPAALLGLLAERYGPIDQRCEPYPFGSSYYEAEMGPGLVKFLVAFAPLIAQERLAGVKRETNALEETLADGRGRVCNVDPGIVTHYSVILATAKGYAHRICLGGGIYAEPALLFRRGGLEALPWTYPDYRSPAASAFFTETRRRLLAQTPGV